MELSYDVDWERTTEHIRFLLSGRVHAKYFSEIFDVSERAAEYKLLSSSKSELTIRELVILARYFRCDILDLLVFVGEAYVEPEHNDMEKFVKVKTQDTSAKEVNRVIDMFKNLDKSYEVRDMYELLLYLPLIEEEELRDVVFRCFGNLEWNRRDYVKSQLTYLYNQIPECPEKKYADGYRDNVLRVKGHPDNNLYDLLESKYSKEYWENIKRYRQEGNERLYKNKHVTEKRNSSFTKYQKEI